MEWQVAGRKAWVSARDSIRESVELWLRADCTTQAAAISFYAALSLFPFVIVLIFGVGWFFEVFESGQSAEATVLNFLSELFSPEMSSSVAELLNETQTKARVGGPVAALALVYLGSRVFTQIDNAFQHIWGVHGKRRTFRGTLKDWVITRLRSFALIGGFGAASIIAFFSGSVLYTVERVLSTWFPDAGSIWGLRSYVASIAANALVFGGLYRFLSKGPVQWLRCLGIGLVVAIVWEVGRILIANVVIGEQYSALGVVGSFLGILVWIFYNNLALLFGAALVRVLTGERSGSLKGVPPEHERSNIETGNSC